GAGDRHLDRDARLRPGERLVAEEIFACEPRAELVEQRLELAGRARQRVLAAAERGESAERRGIEILRLEADGEELDAVCARDPRDRRRIVCTARIGPVGENDD